MFEYTVLSFRQDKLRIEISIHLRFLKVFYQQNIQCIKYKIKLFVSTFSDDINLRTIQRLIFISNLTVTGITSYLSLERQLRYVTSSRLYSGRLSLERQASYIAMCLSLERQIVTSCVICHWPVKLVISRVVFHLNGK